MVKQCVVAAMAAGDGVNSIKHLENLLPNRQPISAGRAEYVLETKHLMRPERSSKKFLVRCEICEWDDHPASWPVQLIVNQLLPTEALMMI